MRFETKSVIYIYIGWYCTVQVICICLISAASGDYEGVIAQSPPGRPLIARPLAYGQALP